MVAHEFAHGWTAYTQGDDTAYKLGRLTLNPLPHIDPLMTLALPLLLLISTGGQVVFGAARPVPVNTRLFRNYKRGDLLVSSAGIITNILLALLSTLIFIALGLLHQATGGAGTSGIAAIQRMMDWSIRINLLLAFFNLIPIPPLDGSRIFYHLLPPGMGLRYRGLDRYGFLLLFALLFLAPGLFNTLMVPAWWATDFLLGLAQPFAALQPAGLLH